MYFLTLLKALATLLVMHSHCDELLPIPALATGGSIEDSFFFAVSGFALYYSVDKEAGDYFKKRVLRVYPAIVIGTLIVMMVMSGVPDFKMICKFNDFTLFGAVKTFLFPTNYHFISAILVLYIIYFVCLHNRGGTEKSDLDRGNESFGMRICNCILNLSGYIKVEHRVRTIQISVLGDGFYCGRPL